MNDISIIVLVYKKYEMFFDVFSWNIVFKWKHTIVFNLIWSLMQDGLLPFLIYDCKKVCHNTFSHFRVRYFLCTNFLLTCFCSESKLRTVITIQGQCCHLFLQTKFSLRFLSSYLLPSSCKFVLRFVLNENIIMQLPIYKQFLHMYALFRIIQ